MATKLSGSVTTVEFNPWPASQGGYPNLNSKLVLSDNETIVVDDMRNGRIGTYNTRTGVSGALTVLNAITPPFGYSGWTNLFWNGDKSAIWFIRGDTKERWSVNPSTGVVTQLANITVAGGATLDTTQFRWVRANSTHAFGFSPFLQAGIHRLEYATGVVTAAPYWKIERWGCVPEVFNDRAYTIMGRTNTYTGGPIVSFPITGLDRNRWKHEACTHPSLQVTTFPAAKKLGALGKVATNVALDADGQRIYWVDELTGHLKCADDESGVSIIATSVGGWNPVWVPGTNKLVITANNTQLKVVS